MLMSYVTVPGHIYKVPADKLSYYIPNKKCSAQVGVRLNPVLTKNGCIKCYISLFEEIILQPFRAFQT